VLVLKATPGVDLLLTVSRTVQAGTRAGVGAALGICCGATVHVLAGAFGLAALLAVSANALGFIKWAGAAYLAWLGLGLLAGSARAVAATVSRAHVQAPGAPHPMGPEFRRGLLTNLLNPKVALFLLAFLPQFVAATAPHKTIAFLNLGAVFVLQSLLFLFATVVLTRAMSRWPMWRGSARWLKRAAGLMFLGLALRLAVTDPDVR
jgi:threonine/homoserine/homoserine lactone efflux protein